MKDVADLFWDAVRPLHAESIVDVGTGRNGVVGLHNWDKFLGRKIAVDIHAIKDLPAGWESLIMDARGLLSRLGPKSVDIVQACDFIEHLPKEESCRILSDFETMARKAVLLFTPIGFTHSPAEDSEPDNPYQRHLCGWTYDELEALGYITGRGDSENVWRDTAIVAWKVLS
jgi:hypothetical protein